MININYNRLFNLHVTHNYYKDEHARGLNLQPTRETEQKLRDGNMLFKTIPHGITVLYRALTDALTDEVSPMVKLGPDLKLTFILRAKNKTEFLNITNLDKPSREYQSGNILYFRNDPTDPSTDPDDPEMITHQLLESCRNKLFTYDFNVSGSPNEVLLGVQNSEGNFVPSGTAVDGTPLPDKVEVAKKDDKSYSRQIDLRNQPKGKYTVGIYKSGESSLSKTEVIYVDDELASEDILGIVDITYNSPSDIYGDKEQYEVQFSRKETFWKYFIVNKNPKMSVSIDDLIIDDATNGTNGYSDPPVYSSINFTKGRTEINGVETVTFKSKNPIPSYEIPNAFIKLIDDSDGSVLLEHLPNPSHSGVVKARGGALESEIYVFI